MKMTKAILYNNECYKTRTNFRPQGIMVHSVGVGQPDAQVFVRSWNTFRPNNKQVCVHAFVDNRGVYQTLPWDCRAWHCGGKGNLMFIGFEITEPKDSWSWDRQCKFFKDAYKNAIELCSCLCKQYKLDPMKDILDHSEGHKMGLATNHSDVGHFFGKHHKTMEDFRLEVKRLMNKTDLDNMPDEYAAKSIEWAINNDLLLGDGTGNFKLHSSMTKQDCISLLYRLYNLMKN